MIHMFSVFVIHMLSVFMIHMFSDFMIHMFSLFMIHMFSLFMIHMFSVFMIHMQVRVKTITSHVKQRHKMSILDWKWWYWGCEAQQQNELTYTLNHSLSLQYHK